MEELIKTIQEKSCPEAWLNAVQHLLSCNGHERFNLSLAIESPELMSKNDSYIFNTVDEFLRDHKEKPLTTVAGTIFPANYYMNEGSHGVYESFPRDYSKLGNQGGWGIYALRMIEKETNKGIINPLKILIDKIKRLKSLNRSAYEINIIDNEIFDIPLYNTSKDNQRHMPQPCLSHMTFKIYPGDKLILTVMYRSHYYVTKALGNLIGLAQLQSFVASETGLGIGPLICHSTHARIDKGKSFKLAELRELVAECLAFDD